MMILLPVAALWCGAVIRIPIFPPAFLIRQERRRKKAPGSL
jgi:hypothetical protein